MLDLPDHLTPVEAPPASVIIRRLGPVDADALAQLHPNLCLDCLNLGRTRWPRRERLRLGAFADRQLLAVANSFFVGDRYEDIGVVTEPAHRG